MKTLLATVAVIALIAAAGSASARTARTMTPAGLYPWMMDDGSSSDFPIHNPGDFTADQLNAQYLGGLPTAPGTGLPAR